ncbi:MAG: hypothetical protein LBE09_06600 [Christensenellaceae bacterium]|nr:hypothetical protein [Christensenellaceae bacterium]
MNAQQCLPDKALSIACQDKQIDWIMVVLEVATDGLNKKCSTAKIFEMFPCLLKIWKPTLIITTIVEYH